MFTSPAGAGNRPQIPVTGAYATQAPNTGPLLVTFIDVGQGDAILIQTPDGKFGLIDGGPANGKALKYLQSHGVKQLEMVAASVPRPEHIGGLVEILNAIPVGRVVTNGQTEASLVYEEFLDAVAESGAVYVKAKRGDALYIGAQRLDVLHPGSIIAQDMAVNSLVLRLAHEKNVFLFMGDAVNISAQEMTASVFPLQAPILKVGHHAGAQALSMDFLNAVQPKIAVYSPGSGEDHDLPSAETIAALKNAGAEVYGTDGSGTVMVISSAAGYLAAAEFETPRTSAPTPAPMVDPKKTLTPVGTPAPDLSVVVTGLTSPVRVGQNAAISIETGPGAVCANIIKFHTGRGGTTSLGIRAANMNGEIGWSWRVGADATPGKFTIDILCGLDGQSAGGVTSFIVTR
jgi:competence protein ComEC